MREGCMVGNQGILTQGNGSVMGYALESAEDHILPSVASPVLRHCLINPKYTLCLSHFSALLASPHPPVSPFAVPL